ncbi:hypothetical protein [Streptomyces phytophilus]|uniref:hypothetical protein n=1 Tax=Streptomyces phytophilus TaxID=722715 RepID=UPI00215D9E94|nr:hypothetical protein [Streptomyces phytophilus]
MVRMQAHGRDRRGHRAARYATLTLPAHLPDARYLAALPRHSPEGCAHLRTGKRGGKTHCRDCETQLYL